MDDRHLALAKPLADVDPFTGRDGALVPVQDLPLRQQREVRALVSQIDLQDSNSIIAFGVDGQRELTTAADRMLQSVRNKDVGPVGDALSELMLKVRGLGVDSLDPGDKPNWFQRVILRRLHPVARFVQRYETVQSQIDDMIVVLDTHRKQLLRDVDGLDALFAATVDYFQRLEGYILAGQAKLRELDAIVIPGLREKADASGDMIDAQRLRDMTARRDDLERRVHDLMLTRQVTLQSLPQMRLIQDVDKSLVSKIQSSILTTIPVWKSQIAMAITLWNQQRALEVQRRVTDTTNAMLAKNAELMRAGSSEARREIERGIFDIDTVKKVNEELIATLEESIEIVQQGHRQRAEAEVEMRRMEGELRETLVNAEQEVGLLGSSTQ